MTGLGRSVSHPTSAENSVEKSSLRSRTKVCQEHLKASADDSDIRSQTEKLPKSRFGRLLQRSMSLIHTSASPRRIMVRKTETPVSSVSSSPQDLATSSSAPSSDADPEDDEDDAEETEEITNAFVFSAQPENSSTNINEGKVSNTVTAKTTVKAVKVEHVHSQKSPHIRYAAQKLVLGEHKDLQSPHRKLVNKGSAPCKLFSSTQNMELERRDSCPILGNLRVGFSTIVDKRGIYGTKLNNTKMESDSDVEETLELSETLPFTVESIEDLEVEAINANAPAPTIKPADKAISPDTIKTHTQELVDYLVQSVNSLHSLEDLDSIRSEKFNLVNEDLSTLDDRLAEEFSALELDKDWTLLGPFTKDEQRETLMHFGCRFRLEKFCKHMLMLPGGVDSLDTPNQSGLLPSDVASNERYDDLSRLLFRSNKDSESVITTSQELLALAQPSVDASELESATVAATMSSTSLKLDANLDMLHELIEQIEIVSASTAASVSLDTTDSADPALQRRPSDHLDSIPETSPLKFNTSTLDMDGPTNGQAMQTFASAGSKDFNIHFSDIWGSRNKEGEDVEVSEGEDEEEDSQSSLSDSIQMARDSRHEIEVMQNQASLRRFSTSCPSLENQAMYEAGSPPVVSSMAPMQIRPIKAHYKSLLDVTQEENEDEVKAAISESPLISRRPSGERPKSLDFSTLGAKLSIAGVTASTTSTDIDDEQCLADKHRKVSFNMLGGAQKEKTKFHQGVTSAGQRSFSLGSLGSEDDEDEQRIRIRERSADSDGHVKPIDIYGAPLQKLPNVDFSKHMGQQSDGSMSSLHSTSQEQLHRTTSSSVVMRHSTQTRTAAMLIPQSHANSNLNKSKSVSTPSINQLGGELNPNTNRHSGLFHQPLQSKPLHSTDSLRRTGTTRRPLSQDPDSTGPSNYEDDDKKSKKGGRRTSVFAKFGSVRKTGKGKDKPERDIKRATHNFISVTLANSICNHCSKLLNYKPSVQCSNCLMNYHDECKDRVLSCPKQKMRERKPAIMQSSNLSSSSICDPPYSLSPIEESIKLLGYRKTSFDRHESGDSIMSPSIGDSKSPSMESLVDDGNADDEYEDDPELNVKGFESESWSETIDKKVLKNHKAKYIQRQDNIWELVATERLYCVNLKIMQRVFAHGMRNECTLPETAINRIFPELDELIELHQAFLHSLQDRQDKKTDRSVDHIGDIIIQHFGGNIGERMRRAYGIFCSRHKECIDYYKHLYKADRKFQSFIKKVSNMACTKRRGVQDLVTVVTMRMTKYKTLIENIIKNTKESKDKQDKEDLNRALELNKSILDHIDNSIHARNQELRLLEIYNRMDARSTAIYDKTKKFKKSDLTAKGRKLQHEGMLYWRNAREKEVETLVVVLSDVILFLQENDKKYSFFTQDNKASVIPMTSLIVREKGSTKDNRGIYLIRQSRENPEMYELVCKSSQERRDWIDLLRKAVNESPEEDEGVINETETVIAKLGKLREYVEILDRKDEELERFCRERFSIIADIMNVYDYADVLQNIKSCYDDDGELRSGSELIKLSLDEASMLASLYQTVPAATNLGRSWSSVGERQSPTYQQMPLPKRAETFNGFDQDQVKSPAAASRSILDRSQLEGKSPSLLNLHQDSDYEGSTDVNGSRTETSRNISVNRRSSSNILQQFLATNSSVRHEEVEGGSDSLLAMSNMLAITGIIPPSKEQAHSVTQLNEYLHGILLTVNKQDSLIESVKQHLADVTVRSKKLELEQEKKSALRNSKQMEEIRNRHEQLTKEREILEAEKENLNVKLERERLEMEALRAEMANQQNDLKKEREELQRQKEALQKQIDFNQVRGSQASDPTNHSPSPSPRVTPHGSNSDLHNSTSSSNDTRGTDVEISHRRSHSAELVELEDPQQLFVDPRYSASLTEPLNMREVRAQQFGHNTSPERQSRTSSAGSLSKSDRSDSQGSLKKISNNNTVQQIPSKLVTSSSSTAASANKNSSNRHSKSMLPLNLAESSKKVSGKESTAKTPKKGDIVYF